MKLLIVDDEELTRTGLVSSIDWESLGITEILQADDGMNGLEMARLHKPEIILCDVRIPTEYLALPTVEDMKQYGFSPLRPELAGQIGEGDIIVAGSNFGCGSSREQAPEIIKALKVKCVIAKSFARIFFRNSINNGLLLIENDKIQDAVKEGDEIEVTLGEKITYNGTDYEIHSLPDNLMEIINAGGLVEAMKKRNGVK